MPVTNIQSLNYSDPQDESIDKINNNFDEIVELHGGSQGIIGPTGSRGEIGEPGELGSTGSSGPRGTRWFVQYIQPSGPGTTVLEGDLWVDSDDGVIYQFQRTGWIATGYSISSVDNVFTSTTSKTAGGTGTAILMDQAAPENYLFILADKVSSSEILDQTLSKFVISTDTSLDDFPLLEFSKSNLEDGSVSDYSQHPVFRWKSRLASNNSLLLQIPGGSFIVGSTGGFAASFQSMTVTASSAFSIEYGTTSGSGIYSTGGFFLNSPSGTFSIESNFFNITGVSGSIGKPVNLIPVLQSGSSSFYSYSDNSPSALQTSRSGDSFSTLSHSIYNLYLESSNGPEFSIDTKGKVLTKKIESGISYVSGIAGATSSVGANPVSWYLVSRSGTTVSSAVLDSGNTIVVSPSVPASNFIGVGIYNFTDYAWGGSGGLEGGQSIDVSVLYSPNTTVTGISDGFKYIGKGATSGDVTNVVTLPFQATIVDFTISKGPTGGSTSVFYKAYGSAGGSGGSFLI